MQNLKWIKEFILCVSLDFLFISAKKELTIRQDANKNVLKKNETNRHCENKNRKIEDFQHFQQKFSNS